jgi:multidrug resistance efflux pump
MLASFGFGLAVATGESRSLEDGDGQSGMNNGPVDPAGINPSQTLGQDMSSRRFVGQIHPGTSVAGVAPMDGSILSLEEPDFGVFVEKGDLLITFSPDEEAANGLREARIAMIEAKAEVLKLQNWSTSSEMRSANRALKEAEHEVKRAKVERDRTQQLFDDGIIAASEHEAALESLRSAESSLEESEAQREEVAAKGTGDLLDIAEERLDIARDKFEALQMTEQDREIRAPISGILLPAPSTEITSSDLSVGQEVKKGTPLFLIGDIDSIMIETSVSEFDLDLIKIGQKATVTSPSQSDFSAVGKVVNISQISSSFGEMAMASGGGYTPPPSRYDVTISVSTTDQETQGTIRIGMTVDIDIDTAAALAASQ